MVVLTAHFVAVNNLLYSLWLQETSKYFYIFPGFFTSNQIVTYRLQQCDVFNFFFVGYIDLLCNLLYFAKKLKPSYSMLMNFLILMGCLKLFELVCADELQIYVFFLN